MKKRCMVFLMALMAASLAGCSENDGAKNNVEKNYADEAEAEAYSVYAIPVETGANYQAYDFEGGSLELLDGRFAVREAGTYSYSKQLAGKLTWHKVNVRDTIAPEIELSYQKRYVAPGSVTALPDIQVTDSDGTTDYTLIVTREGQEISVAEGSFTPTVEGEYLITVQAADASGNRAEKTAVVACTSDRNRLNCIYEMDTVYGLEEQTTTRIGVRLKLADEKTPEQTGAGKVKVVAARTFSDGRQEHMLFFQKPFCTEWKEELSGIYFWVRNVSDVAYDFDFMGEGIQFTLENGATTTMLTKEMGWQKVEIRQLDRFLLEDGRSFAGMIDMEDCVGMYLGIRPATQYYKYGEILISSIYGIPKTEE